MFGWNQKRVGLAIAVTCVAGCASSDFRVRPTATNGPIGARDAGIADAKQAPAPSILPQTHFAAGKLFESQGLFSKAILQYRKAVAVNHHYAEAQERLALLLSRIGRHEEAVRTFRQAVKIKPRDPALRNNLGFELLLTGKVVAAEKMFQEAIRLDGTFARAFVNLGIAQGRQRRFDEALATFQSVLPEADAYYNLALVHRGQGNLGSTGAALRHVLAIDPDFTAAQQQLDQLAKKISAAQRSQAVAQAAEAAARRQVAVEQVPVATLAIAPQPKRANVVATTPRPPLKTDADAKARNRVIAMANDALDAPVEPTPAATKPAPAPHETAKTAATKPVVKTAAVTRDALTKPEPVAVSAPSEPTALKSAETLAVRPRVKSVQAPTADRSDVRKKDTKPKTIDQAAKVAELKTPKIMERVPVLPARSEKVVRSYTPRPTRTPTEPIAQPTPNPQVVELLERRNDVAGFQTDRPDIAGPIEILLNDINCLNDADAELAPALTAVDADAIDFDFTDASKAMTPIIAPVASAWSLQLSSVAEMLPDITANDPIEVVVTASEDDDEPCQEALVIDYVPASDPVLLMGECTSAFDPSLPVVYAEQSFVPQGYDGMGYALTKSETASPLGDFICPAVLEDRPMPTLVAVRAPLPVARGPISSVNRTVVLRQLDESLMVVRNEIACLESADDAIRIAQRDKTKKVPSVRLVSERDAKVRRHDRPSRRIGSTTKRRTTRSTRPGARPAKPKGNMKSMGIAPTTKRHRAAAAKSTSTVQLSRHSRRKPSSHRKKSFERLDGLAQIVANEIRCMADQAFEESVARRAAEVRKGVVSNARSLKTGSGASTGHRRKPSH